VPVVQDNRRGGAHSALCMPLREGSNDECHARIMGLKAGPGLGVHAMILGKGKEEPENQTRSSTGEDRSVGNG
jgi:hypothetical protein